MSQIDLLQRQCSTGARNVPRRNNFHIYLWPYDGNSNLQPSNGAAGLALMDYYGGLGMNFTRDHYDISGAGPFIQANINTGVDFWAGRAEALRIDLWWIDNEGSYYTGDAADAALNLGGAQNGVDWSKTRWATHFDSHMYVGEYGSNTGINVQGIIGYPWQTTNATWSIKQNDNTVSGINVANTWEWLGNELYQTKIDEWCLGMEWLCREKSRMGIITPLIPFIWRRTVSTTYNMMSAMLEYAYDQPECNGLVLWGTQTAASSPDYYNGEPWMQATLDFMVKYKIVRGNPF